MNLYDLVVLAGYPLQRWARLEVHGEERLPADGPLIIAANHDSMFDPLAVAAACRPTRYVRFLAMAELWKNPILRFVLDRLGQIPIERSGGGGTQALQSAIIALEKGETVCIFPEGKLSLGRSLRARHGLAQLITACPDVPIVLAAVIGADDVVRFPKRPRARVTFLTPVASETPTSETPTNETPTSETPTNETPTSETPTGETPTGETPSELPQRLLDQIRAVAPPVAAGRHGRLATRLRARRVRRRRSPTPAPGRQTRPS